MITRHFGIQVLLLAAAFLFSVFALASSPQNWHDWEHGTAGYDRAWDRAVRNKQPMIVYFHADWCGWCRRLESEYLLHPEVRQSLHHFTRVEINPEVSAEERQLFREYGGSGYPSLYVLVPGAGPDSRKISPFRRNNARSVYEFADLMADTARRQLNRWGLELARNNNTSDALEIFDRSISLMPNHYYAHYMKGWIMHRMGHQRRDPALLRQARTHLQQAQRLDPSDEGVQRELQQIDKVLSELNQ